MRKLAIALVLPLLLLVCQQGALWHEIGHLSSALAPAGEHKHQPADEVCVSCLAFEHLATAAKPDVVPLRLALFGRVLAPAERVQSVASGPPAQRNPGPPAIL